MTATQKHNVPKLRFPEFLNNLKDIAFASVIDSTLYGPRFNANDYDPNGNVKTIRGTDVGLNGEIKYDQVPTALLDTKTVDSHKLCEGDLVMITTADCGVTGVFRSQNVEYISSAYAVRIRLNQLGDSFYFKFFFQTNIAKSEISRFVRKATVSNLPGSDVLKIKVRLPKLNEQKKIASFLSAVDSKIEQLSKKKELLEQYKKGMIQKIFGQEIRFKDDNGNSFPDWGNKRLEDVATTSTGDSNREDSGLDGEFAFFDRSEDIRTSNRYLFDGEAVIVAGEGQSFPPKYFFGKFDLHQRAYAIMKFKNVIGRFIFYYLRANPNYFLSQAVGSTVKSLRLPMFNNMPLFLPKEEDEQQKIADFLSSLDNKIDLITEELSNAQNFKKALLQQMFI